MKKQNEINKQQMSLNTAKNSSKNRKKLTLHKVAKGMQGITLIALVVTIIVLLILAGIALNLTIGQNGIFSRAEKAANTWRNAETNEQLALGELADWMDKYANGKGETGDAEEPEEGTLAWMYEQAIADGCTNDDGTCDNPNHLHIGDYVDFGKKVNEYLQTLPSQAINVEVEKRDTGMSYTQHYTVSASTNQVKWRVLGYDNQKKEVKLKAETPLQTSDSGQDGMLGLYGAEAYLYAPARLDSICDDIYGKMGIVTEARSMKMEDVNNVFGITDIKSKDVMPIMNDSSYEYGDSLSSITGVTPDDFINYLNDIKETHPEVTCSEEYNDNYNLRSDFTSKYGKPLTNEKVTGYAYIISDGNDNVSEMPLPEEVKEKIINTSSTKYDLLFKNATYETSGAYWLSSPGVYERDGFAYFGPGAVGVNVGVSIATGGGDTFYSNGYVYYRGFGLCPVVSLESGVRTEDVPKV